MSVTITTVKKSEYEPWAEIFRQYLEFYETTLPEEQYKNTWGRIQDPNGDIKALVARDENGTIIDLFVDPNIRGKGTGRALIVATGEKAFEKGCKRLQWTTKHDNYTAQKLYDTMGTSEFKQYRMNLPYKS